MHSLPFRSLLHPCKRRTAAQPDSRFGVYGLWFMVYGLWFGLLCQADQADESRVIVPSSILVDHDSRILI